MLLETGIVDSTQGQVAQVRTQRKEACNTCSVKAGCHTLGGGSQEMLVEVDNPTGARIGDRVEIVFRASSFLRASFLLYMVPVLGLLVGVFAGESLAPRWGLSPQAGSMWGALILAGATGAWVWSTARRMSRRARYRPRIRRILAPGAIGKTGQACGCS